MLSIFICEDDVAQRQRLELYIQNYIMIEEYDMELVLATHCPHEVLDYVQSHKNMTGLYFLDVELNDTMTGIDLAAEIRNYDDLGKIVFITTHSELAYMTFTYKVEALDYIIKDDSNDIQKRVGECMAIANKRYLNDHREEKKVFKVSVGSQIRGIDYREIMFFESSTVPHKIILHMENGQLEFYHSIKELANIATNFYRCHKSFVVNKENIKYIDKTKREIEMINEEICLVSVRGMKGLK